MKRKKTRQEQEQDEKVKYWFTVVGFSVICLTLLFGAFQTAFADEMRHKFKSPSFSGNGTSQHYLTIENQEHLRKKQIEEEKQALLDELERDEANSTVARFIRNLESRVYANLSRQLVENLFGEDAQQFGSIMLEGNLIEYVATDETITLTITDENGQTTDITFPLNSFTF